MLTRRTVLGGLLLPVLARPALALDSKAAITALNRPDLAADLGRSPERVVLGDWGSGAERLVACAILNQDDDSIIALLLRDGPDGRAQARYRPSRSIRSGLQRGRSCGRRPWARRLSSRLN